MITITEYCNKELDARYNKTAKPLLDQVKALSTNTNSLMQKRLRALDKEAARLREKEKHMEPDNAVLNQTIGTYESLMTTASSLITANDNIIQESGIAVANVAVTAKVFLSFSQMLMAGGTNPVTPQAMQIYTGQLAQAGIPWNSVSTVQQVINYVDSPVWIERMEKWGSGYADLARKVIIADIEKGAGPIAVASHLRQIAENMPVHASETLTRTLQLTSYRDASVAMERINGKYITGKVRIAALDGRTCSACLALHGTELALGQRVDDHFRGRCTEFYRVPGGAQYPAMMQADSTPGNRQFVPWQTGEEWFASLPEERQRQQASFAKSPGKWEAYKAGTPLSAFVGEHEDAVFGNMVVEKGLGEVITK